MGNNCTECGWLLEACQCEPENPVRSSALLESLAETFERKSEGAYQAGWKATVSRERLWTRSECFRECANDVRAEIAKLSNKD